MKIIKNNQDQMSYWKKFFNCMIVEKFCALNLWLYYYVLQLIKSNYIFV